MNILRLCGLSALVNQILTKNIITETGKYLIWSQGSEIMIRVKGYRLYLLKIWSPSTPMICSTPSPISTPARKSGNTCEAARNTPGEKMRMNKQWVGGVSNRNRATILLCIKHRRIKQVAVNANPAPVAIPTR